MRTALFLVTAAALLAGCASGPGRSSRAELDELARDCEARGGILAPTGNVTGRVQTENVCEIRGATRIPRR